MNIKEELWRLAVLVAMTRVGLLALQRDEDGVWIPPGPGQSVETRSARRKYRKLWRRGLARQLREFDKLPKRRQARKNGGWVVKGRWRWKDDALECMLLKVQAAEVGRSPRKNARGQRWNMVKECPELRKELLKAAAEFGLLDPKRQL